MASAPSATRVSTWRGYASGALLAALLSSLFIVGSYRSLSQTFDEPTHLAAGLEWLQLHRYIKQTENPPLSRVPLAIVPYLTGMRLGDPSLNGLQAGTEVLYGPGTYVSNLTKARIANLVMFWLVLLLTWILAGGRTRPRVAMIATVLVATLPAFVGHSGLATTDVPFVVAFLFAVCRWKATLEELSPRNAVWLGVSIGVALATKFSTIPFLPPAALALLATYAWSGRLAPGWTSPGLLALRALAVLVLAAVTIWASYGFRVGRLADMPPTFDRYGPVPSDGLPGLLRNITVPAPEFVHGLLYLQAHTKAGHRSYMLGTTSRRGFWLYYPVMLGLKTPPLTLLLFLIGGAIAVRDRAAPAYAGYALGALGVLLVATTSPINLGVRHILALFPLASLAAAYGVVNAMEQKPGRATVVAATTAAVVVVQVGVLAASYPRQMSYYNVLAASDPAHFISDSDFEWGQDIFALEDWTRANAVEKLYVVPNGSTLLCRHSLPPIESLPVDRQVNGWIAVFTRQYQMNGDVVRKDPCRAVGPGNSVPAPEGWLNWLRERKPVAIVGSGVRMYHVTDAR